MNIDIAFGTLFTLLTDPYLIFLMLIAVPLGAFFGAMLVGLIDTLGRAFLDDLLGLVLSHQAAETSAPAISAMLIYILMAVILYFRPQGLFGVRGA